jgi:hypothetical protein
MGANRPGPMCTTRGDYVDEGTACAYLTPSPGPASTERRLTVVPSPLREALSLFEAESAIFASRFIPDHAVRKQYILKTRQMADTILDEVRRGAITAEEGQRLAQQLRNELMATMRGATSDIGRAWAESLKKSGRTLLELQEHYAARLFKRGFDTLAEAERNQVYLAIIEASGRARPSVLVTSARLARLSRGLLFVTAALAVFDVTTAEDPGREAVKQGAVIGAGLLGAAGAGALASTAAGVAATSLLCGPAAPVCVGLIVFVGGGLVAFGAESAFDHWVD